MITIDALTLLTFTTVCAVSDLKTHKIPNRLILCGFLLAAPSRIFCFIRTGPSALADGAAGLLLPLILLGALAALRMIGGGDVKLLAVIGLQTGARESLHIIYLTFIIAALWSFFLVVRRHNLFDRFRHLYQYLVHVMAYGHLTAYRTDQSDPSGEFCFSLPVLAALSIDIFHGQLLMS